MAVWRRFGGSNVALASFLWAIELFTSLKYGESTKTFMATKKRAMAANFLKVGGI